LLDMTPDRNDRLTARVGQVRAFNRFYTRHLGLLKEGLYGSRFTLAEVRVLRELLHGTELTASRIGDALGMDAAFLSKILRRFERDGLIRRSAAKHDARQKVLSITANGRRAFAPLEVRADDQVAQVLKSMSSSEQQRLVQAMSLVQALIERAEPGAPLEG
jgi:DNA-binding MarR family transcriptional regulator